MLGRSSYVVGIVLLTACPDATGGATSVDLSFMPGSFQDVGNIASDGSGGRRSIVRGLEQGETSGYVFFSDFLSSEDRFAEPPATPSQGELVLLADQPLALVIPQLSHFPNGADVFVEHSTVGSAVDVDASIHFLGYSTDWLAPPHEYIHVLGAFTPGDYRLTLNLSRSDWKYPHEPSVRRGFIDFTVVAVPEPSAWLMAALVAVSIVAMMRRSFRR